MSTNTVEENRLRNHFPDRGVIWLFGYGSLIFKADFPYLRRRPATIRNWERRFWQGSHDHRGTEQAPGRVVTLVQSQGATCNGMAYRISQDVLDHLDHREKNGYLRFNTSLAFADGSEVSGLIYIATEKNAAYLGPASDAEIALQIAKSSGPSGRNTDYLLDLAGALRELGAEDPHVFEIEKQLVGFSGSSKQE